VPGPAEALIAAEHTKPLASGTASAHLRWLRHAVPHERLFAPRVAVLLATPDGERVVVDRHGALPWADVDLETSLTATALGVLAGLGLLDATPSGRASDDVMLEPVAALAGPAWWSDGADLGPLAPVWIVVRPTTPSPVDVGALPTASPGVVALASAALGPASCDIAGDGSAATATGDAGPVVAGDYIARVRRHIGHARIFYPWAGTAVRDDAGRLLLVRHAGLQQWHCPGGGMEVHETPAGTAARELREETGLEIRPGRLIGCFSRHIRAFPNGDRIQGVALLMDGAVADGSMRPDPTGEIDAMDWFSVDDLPPLHPPWDARARLALTGEGATLD
jgi:8-oxo-dGTP pyrophosphatase MutT (NUDIX family)